MDKINELKNAIINNPNLPIRFFVGEDSNCGDYQYEENYISNIVVDYVTLYDGQYLNKEQLDEKLYYDLCDDFESQEDLYQYIDALIANINFKNTIVVFLS